MTLMIAQLVCFQLGLLIFIFTKFVHLFFNCDQMTSWFSCPSMALDYLAQKLFQLEFRDFYVKVYHFSLKLCLELKMR